MVYKYTGFAAAFMAAASPCLGAGPRFAGLTEDMDDSHEYAIAREMTEATLRLSYQVLFDHPKPDLNEAMPVPKVIHRIGNDEKPGDEGRLR